MTNRSSFDIINGGAHKLQGKFGKAFLATLILIAPLALIACIPYAGWAISLFIWGVMETGYIRYMRELMNGNNPKLSLLFSEIKTGWLECFLGAILVSMFLVGTVLVIVPGIVLVGYYSMSLFVAEHEHCHTIGEAMNATAKRMEGNKTTMFSYKVLFYFIYLLIMVAFCLLGYYVVVLYASSTVISVLLGIASGLVLILIWSLVTVYYHAANAEFFSEVMLASDKQVAEAAPVEAAPAVSIEVQPAETKVEEQAKAEPATKAKSTTAKKTTTKKSTTKTTKK